MLFFNQGVALHAEVRCDPLIGERQDHPRSRPGRRHPRLYASAVPIGLVLLVLWNPRPGWSNQSPFVCPIALLVTVRLLLFFRITAPPLPRSDYDQHVPSIFVLFNLHRERIGVVR